MKFTVMVGQFDGEGCQPEHIPEASVVVLSEALIGPGWGQAILECFGDGHRQLQAGFFCHLGNINQHSVGDGLGAGVRVDDGPKKGSSGSGIMGFSSIASPHVLFNVTLEWNDVFGGRESSFWSKIVEKGSGGYTRSRVTLECED